MVVPGCGDAPGPTRTAEPAAPRARSEAEAPALPDCWEGEVHVEERLHPGPPEPGCEPAGEIVWKGTALVRVRRGDRESRGWLIPHSPLHYERIDYEITQTGFEQRCIRPDPAPGLSGRSSREVRRIVQDASHRGVLEGGAEETPAGLLHHRAPPPVSPSGRPLPEPIPSPDKVVPGQYELRLPAPCRHFEAPGVRIDGGSRFPAPHLVRCSFGNPLLGLLQPGRTRADDARGCADARRTLDAEGAMSGRTECAVAPPGGERSELAARWDLRPVACPPPDAAP